MRIALALLVIAACNSKSSAPEDRSSSPNRSPDPVGGAPGSSSGSAPVAVMPAQETQIGSANEGILAQQAKVALGEVDAGVPSELPADLGSGSGKGPPGKITIKSKTSFDQTNLSADAVAEKIAKEHLVVLGNCYRQTLRRDGSVKGKAVLALTVRPDGKVASAKATTLDATLQACFTQAMQSWTFPVPKDADGEVTEAGFQIELVLAPE